VNAQPATASSRLRGDIASAYLVAGSRIAGWLVVSALIFRRLGAESFAIFALIRGTIGLLNYISLGLSPALIHYGAQRDENRTLRKYFSSALLVVMIGGVIGLLGTVVYAAAFKHLLNVPPAQPMLPAIVLLMGIGMLARLGGDAPGAILQVSHRIKLDNLLVAAGDLLWAALSAIAVLSGWGLLGIAVAFFASGLLPLLGRLFLSLRIVGGASASLIDRQIVRVLVGYGAMVVLAQLADYLYAPTDYILINKLLERVDVAAYAPAVQIDSGLLLLVIGLSAVLLPHAADAHAAGSPKLVRRYYVNGTLSSAIILLVCCSFVWLIAPTLLKTWLGEPMPQTLTILPLVLMNTVIGGCSAVGRSILLAVGRARPFAIAALISGAVNVVSSYAFVRFFHLGLRGIVLGTTVAIIGRCMIWMPWYVLRTIRLTPISIPATIPIDAPID
jgi:O-antigen/teichoic acid export membrane protein